MARPQLLAVDGVSYAYPRGPAVLNDVSMALEAGQVTAILGPNGAGKSTLFRLMAGFAAPTHGRVLLGDLPILDASGPQRARQIAVAAQDPERPRAWSALEVTLMGRVPHLGGRQLEDGEDHVVARESLERLGASDLAARAFGQLSGGEQQRVLLARAICQDTPILLLDEPTSHLDPRHALNVATVCRELAADGRAVGCVLHDLNLAAQMADQVVLLKEGTIVAAGPPAEVLSPDHISAVYGVQSARLDHQGRTVLVFDR